MFLFDACFYSVSFQKSTKMDKSDCNTSCSIVSQVAVMIINVIFGVGSQ